MMDKYAKAIETYIDAWNKHDESMLNSIFIEGGTYKDSATGSSITEQAILGYAKSLWTAFPDLFFEKGKSGVTPDGSGFVVWVMRGTNSGSFNGMPPTGRTIAIDGVDIFTFQEDKLLSVQGFFNLSDLFKQMGL